MGMNSVPETEPVRTMEEYRAERAKKKAGRSMQDPWGLNGKPDRRDTLILETSGLMGLKQESPKSPIGLMSTTILEEDDTSEAEFG